MGRKKMRRFSSPSGWRNIRSLSWKRESLTFKLMQVLTMRCYYEVMGRLSPSELTSSCLQIFLVSKSQLVGGTSFFLAAMAKCGQLVAMTKVNVIYLLFSRALRTFRLLLGISTPS